MQFPLGFVLDRHGPRRVNAALFLFVAAGALSFSLAISYGALVASRTLIGFGVSAALIGAMQAFVLWYPRERIGTMISVVYACAGVGIILTSFPLAYALQVFDWREIFAALAVLALAVCALLVFVVPERTASRGAESAGTQFGGFASILRDPGFRCVALVLAANQFAVPPLLNLWMATWLRDLAGYTEQQVAWMLALVALAMIAGYLVSGRLGDACVRRGRSEFPVFFTAVAGTLAALLPLAFGAGAAAAAAWPFFVFFGMGATLAHAIASRRFAPGLTGRVNTILNFCGLLAMFLGQWAVGVVLGWWPQTASGGYDPRGYALALGAQGIALALALAWLWRRRRLFTAARCA